MCFHTVVVRRKAAHVSFRKGCGNMWGEKRKGPKRKPEYGMFSCVAYMYGILWEHERSLVFVGIFTVPVSLAVSALSLYIPSIVLRCLETFDRFSFISLVIIGLVLADTLFALADNYLSKKTEMAEFYVISQLQYQQQKNMLERDFYLDYDPEVKEKDERAKRSIENNHTRAVHFPMDFAGMAAVVAKFLFFGTVISVLDFRIILLLAVGCVVNIPLYMWERKKNYETQDKRNILLKKIGYLAYQVARDFKYGKDIRLYHFRGYLSRLADGLFGQYKKEREKVEHRSFLVAFAGFLVVLIRDGAAYVFLIGKALAGEMDAAQFVLYFSAITEMAGFMSEIIWKWSGISEGALQVSDYREGLEIGGRLNRGEGIPAPSGAFSIEFKNVSFKYQEGEREVLKNISFKIEAGEKIALVGVNGAGKTTLTRLLCGLLLPTQGEILINGHTLYEYNRDEMYALFGLVPQNYHLLPVSIARNIACTMEDHEINKEKLMDCIKMAGFDEKVKTLPKGAMTPLDRQVNPDGTRLSGGEIQKLLLARLLYRNPKCMILDEPTAALDPIAEDRMYRRYHEIVKDSTSIFISHRLNSTRFCDRIFLLDDAGIAEMGTHEELIAAGKKYKELFEIQSKYYKDKPDCSQGMEVLG